MTCKVPPDLFHSKSWHGLCRSHALRIECMFTHRVIQSLMIRTGHCEVLARTGSCHILVPGWNSDQTECGWRRNAQLLVGSFFGKLSCFATQNGQFSMSGSHHCQVAVVVRFAGNLSSNARDCLDRENKQPSLGAVLWRTVEMTQPAADVTCPESREEPTSLSLPTKHLFVWLHHWKHSPRPKWMAVPSSLSPGSWQLPCPASRTHAFTHSSHSLIYESINFVLARDSCAPLLHLSRAQPAPGTPLVGQAGASGQEAW